MYWDDTPDPESGLSIEKGHVFRNQGDKLCLPTDKYLQSTDEEELEQGYMMPEEEYRKYKYEDPLVMQLMNCEVKIIYLKYSLSFLPFHMLFRSYP